MIVSLVDAAAFSILSFPGLWVLSLPLPATRSSSQPPWTAPWTAWHRGMPSPGAQGFPWMAGCGWWDSKKRGNISHQNGKAGKSTQKIPWVGIYIYIYIIYIYVIWYSSQDGIAADIETNVWFLGCLVVLMATRNPARKPPFGNFFYNGLMGCLPNINWLAGFLPFSPYVWWFFHDWYHDSMQISLIRDFLQWQTGKMSDFFRGEWRKVAVVAACCRYTCCHIL